MNITMSRYSVPEGVCRQNGKFEAEAPTKYGKSNDLKKEKG